MAYTTINGIKINYEMAGKGTPLLMFAPGGFGSTIARWTAAGGRTLAGDVGLGRTHRGVEGAESLVESAPDLFAAAATAATGGRARTRAARTAGTA